MKKCLVFCFALFIAFDGRSQLLSDTLQLKAFMDGLIQTHLRDKHIAGAAVSVVQNGKILMTRGYGFSDMKAQLPVKADSTLFRIGSISKMFVWISVMQLVSQGKLKLNEDINHYLKDFKIPATYPKPITLKNLMTHTAGFEDRLIGLFASDPGPIKPLGEILKRELPARVRPPGIFASYSNHGAGIAAYIVEQVSGMSFNNYVEKNILQPLHMNVTSFRQPLPRTLRPMMSKGYKFDEGELIEQPFEYVPLYPIGGAASSAADMVRFMKTILNYGRYDQFQMLDSVTLELMESPAHRHHPSVNAMRYGFMDMSYNGITVIGHGGDTFWFHSLMALYPEFSTGLFISFNTDKGAGVYSEVLEEFTDRYFPKRPLRKPIKVGKKFLERFTGAYRINQYAHHDITTIASLLGDIVIARADSTRIKMVVDEKAGYYIPADSLTFREEHGSKVIAFKENERGEITQMFIGNLSILALDKVSGLGSTSVHKTIFLVVAVITVMMLFYWPITSRARKGFEPMGSTLLIPIGAKFVAWVNYFLLATFYVGLLIIFRDPESIVFGVPVSLKILLVVPFLLFLTTLLMFMNLYRLWGNRRYKVWSRVFYLLISLVSAAALWQLYYWNFVGFNF